MSNTVIVDANLAIKWVWKEPDSETALALLKEWKNNRITLLAPALFTYEVTNVIYQNVRRNKITLDQAKKVLTQVLSIGIELEFTESATLSSRALELAHQFNLPATYDTHYLALAEREGCELWTADTKLRNAIKGQFAWVRWLEDYHATQN